VALRPRLSPGVPLRKDDRWAIIPYAPVPSESMSALALNVSVEKMRAEDSSLLHAASRQYRH
jgi:hypothetical protein